MSPTKKIVKIIDSNIKSPGDLEYDKQNCPQHLLFITDKFMHSGERRKYSLHIFRPRNFFFEVLDNFAYYNRELQGSFTRIFHFQKYFSWELFLNRPIYVETELTPFVCPFPFTFNTEHKSVKNKKVSN